MRGEIDCKAPELQLLRYKAMEKLRSWPIHEFLHMKRDWNQSADRQARKAFQQDQGTIALSDQDWQNLSSMNRLDELLTPKSVDQVVKIAAVTRSAVRRRRSTEVLKEGFIRQVRIERIKQVQEEESWIANLKEFRIGDITKLSVEEAKICARIASEYEVDERGLLDYCFSALDQRNIQIVAWI